MIWPNRIFLAMVIALCGCIYQEPDRVYEAADCPDVILAPPAHISENAPDPAPSPADVPVSPISAVPASSLDGFFRCGDACGIIGMGGCADLEQLCGLTCGTNYDIDDPCAPFGTPEHPLEFVVTSSLAPSSCAEAMWFPPVCAKNDTPVTVAYCCTVDGSALGQ